MHGELGLLASVGVIFTLTVLVVAALFRLALPLLITLSARFDPAVRAQLWQLGALLPVFVGLGVVALVLTPSLLHAAGVGLDHCLSHHHHAHLCLIHTPLFSGGVLEQSLLGAVLALLSLLLSRFGWRARRAWRSLDTLSALGGETVADYRIIHSPRMFALTLGLWRPRILIAARLREALTPAELAIVLNHERAHRQRRDGLRLFLAGALSRLHWPSARRIMLAQLGLSIEQACDEAAAQITGDRLQVAETIIKMTRLSQAAETPALPYAVSISSSDAVLRVERLLSPRLPVHSRLLPNLAWFAAALLLVGLAKADGWHHYAETLIDLILG
jgi:hypothetical protein